MAEAVVNDYGDEIAIPTGEDLTGWTLLLVYITKPDGTQLAKTHVADGVTDKGAPTGRTIYYVIQSGVLTIDGEYRFEAGFTNSSGIFTTTEPIFYNVKRVNQTVE